MFGHKKTSMINKINTLLILFFVTSVSACTDSSDSDFPATPLGDNHVLEKLADAYRKESDRLPGSLSFVTPKVKKKFVREIFKRAGFSYNKTLLVLANSDRHNITKLHKDLAELLALPHQGLNQKQKFEIYSESEIVLVNRIDELL